MILLSCEMVAKRVVSKINKSLIQKDLKELLKLEISYQILLSEFDVYSSIQKYLKLDVSVHR